jgi:hypothetical protein
VARGGRGRRGAQDTANAMRNRMMARGCGGFLDGGRWCSSGRRSLGGEENREAEGMRSEEGRPRCVAPSRARAWCSPDAWRPRDTEFLRTVGHDARSSF